MSLQATKNQQKVLTLLAENWVQAKSMLTKVSANNTVPCGIVLFVKLLLDECSYVFLHVVLLQRLQRVITSHQLVDLDVAPGHCPSNVAVLDYDVRSNKVLHRSHFLVRACQRDFTKSDTCVAQSMASCCISSDMSAFLITAFLSDMMPVPSIEGATRQTGV